MNMAARVLAFDDAMAGITTVALAPGWVRTDMGGPSANLAPEESARALLTAIQRLDASDNGRSTATTVWSWTGNRSASERVIALMRYQIKKAAVIGSGTMGGGIAALLAGVGIETLLLDIPPPDSTPEDGPPIRNAIVARNLKTLQRMRPAQLYSPDDLAQIRIGNTEDDLEQVGDADWVIEVIVENLEIKRGLMARLVELVQADAIVTTNTSGIPIGDIAESLPAQFTRRFLGTHFFNPPRYLRLLEVIPHAGTDPDIVDFMMRFGAETLGKGTVRCNDTPNFIANRFTLMSGMHATNYALDQGYTVEEVDALTGALIGRPKTATFHLNDLVGFDIHISVARNLYHAIPDDPARELLLHEKNAELSDELLERGWLGRKTGRGFYHMRRDGGKKELWALNLDTLEYEPPSRPRFDSVGKYRKVEPLGERIRLLMNAEDRAGAYLYHLHAFALAYASNCIPEITDTIVNIDSAQRWGFAHELGPFEIWDAIGVADTVDRFEADGYTVADWVKQMVAAGCATFYQRDAGGKVTGYYSPQDDNYLPMASDPRCYHDRGPSRIRRRNLQQRRRYDLRIWVMARCSGSSIPSRTASLPA